MDAHHRCNPTSSRRAGAPAERGSIGVAMIASIVVIQLIMVAVVISGARDQDTVLQRVDSARAFYACEAGANMAIREYMVMLDESGDGTVGTISNDGNAANDPELGRGRFFVSSAASGGLVTVTTRGRSGDCERRAEVVLSGGPAMMAGGNTSTVVAFGRKDQRAPRYALWSGSAWGANTALPWMAPDKIRSVAVRGAPVREEIAFLCDDESKALCFCVFNGTTWSSVTTVGTDVARDKDRPFDVAYEAVSGRAMIAFWDHPSGEPAYRIWDGAALGAKVLMAGSGIDHSHFLRLVSRPGTNEIMCLVNDHGGTHRILAKVWDGSSWSAWSVLTTNLPKFDREAFAGAYESKSGRGMVVYGEKDQAQPRYRTWNGTSWSAASTLPSIGNNAFWVRLAPDPNSDTIHCAMADSAKDLEVNTWDGSAWGTNQQFTTDQGVDKPRLYDLSYEQGSSTVLLTYRNNLKNYPVYRTWNAGVWSAEQNGPNINRKLKHIELALGFEHKTLWSVCCDDQNDLHVFKWNGTSLGNHAIIETDLAADGEEPANVISAPFAWTKAKIQGWTEVAP